MGQRSFPPPEPRSCLLLGPSTPSPQERRQGESLMCVLEHQHPFQGYKGLTLKNSSSAFSPEHRTERYIAETWSWTPRAVIFSIRLAAM